MFGVHTGTCVFYSCMCLSFFSLEDAEGQNLTRIGRCADGPRQPASWASKTAPDCY